MWPHPETIARAIVEAAKLEGEDPLAIADGAVGSHARLWAFLALAGQFKAPTRWRLARKVGASGAYECTARVVVTKAVWFDLTKVNAVRRALGYDPLTKEDCVRATYSSRLLHSHRRKYEKKMDTAIEGEWVESVELVESGHKEFESPAVIVERAASSTALALKKQRVSQDIMAFADLDRIPSRAEQLLAEGGRMEITPTPGEPSFERSALAQRWREPIVVPAKKDSTHVFTEGYTHGLHGVEMEFPADMLGLGPDYRNGWLTGFNDRPLLRASQEEFDAAMVAEED